MRFRLLGPLEIHNARIAADKQRTVLAMLLVHAGNVVPVSTLITEVWGEQPPRSAAPNLRGYVMQLRRLLPAEDRLVTSRSGYQLFVDPDDFDLPRFEHLADAGRQALAQADLTAANEAFSGALELWRGAAAEDVPLGPMLGEVVARLTEQYLAIVEDHVEVELALGRHGRITAALRSWIRQHPLREKLHCQLVLALYRSGDVPGALDAFTAARRTLADELGIDPGEELGRLHEQVLHRDPGLLLPSTLTSVPRQLPPEPAVFVGRTAELASARGPVVAFHGPGGVGKSTLALKVAHRVAGRYPDGQLYVDLQGSSPGLPQLEPAEVVGRFLRALGVSCDEVAAEPAEAFAKFQSLLADRRVLVVLDNAADAGQVTPLLPANRDCAVLITSRTALTTVDALRIPVDVLSSQDSLTLLGLLAGDSRVAAEAPAAADITRWCGGHPLALRIAGARLAGRPDWSLSQFEARLADRRRRLDELRVADLGVRTCFAIGYESLGSDVMAAKAFRLLGVLGVPEVGVELVAVLLDVDELEAERALDRLVEVRLLDPVAGVRFRTHDLLRLYAAELAAAEDRYVDRTLALQRALDWYLAMCGRAEAQEFDSFDAEVPCLVAAATQAAEREPGIARFAIDLVPRIRALAIKRSHWRELEILSDLALTVARRDRDSRGEARTLGITSTMEWRAGRIPQARSGMLRALELWRAVRDPEGEGLALHNLGWLSMWTGELDQALEHLTESLRLLRAHNSSKIIIAQHNLSEVLLRLGKHSEAVDSFHTCLELRRTYDDKIGESVTLVGLGRAYCVMDQRADALRTIDNALISCRQVGNRDDEWEALLCRSEIWLREGNPQAAMTDALTVESLTADIDDDYGQAAAARQLARAHSALGDTASAAASRRRAYSLLASPSMRRDPVLEQLLTSQS